VKRRKWTNVERRKGIYTRGERAENGDDLVTSQYTGRRT